MAKKFDIYQTVTDKIVAALEKGVVPWAKPWQSGLDKLPYNAYSKKEYNGINVFLLWLEQLQKGYNTAGWITYNQAKQLGANVRKGEKATMVVWWNILYKKEKDAKTGEDKDRKIFLLRYYNVFNLNQIENLPEKFLNGQVVVPQGLGNQLSAEYIDFVKATGAKIENGGGKAAYIPALDIIKMPELKYFKTADDYALTELHELAHWTGDKKRLDRKLDTRFGSESYAGEELVAEMTAAFLAPVLNVRSDIDRHAAYLDSWIAALKADKKAIFTAVSAATKAANFLRGIKGEEDTSEEAKEAA